MATGANIAIFEAVNQLSGRSFTLDALMALLMDSPLAKGGPIAACFIFAWWSRADDHEVIRRRRILLLTLATLFVLAPFTKVATHFTGLSPRPLVQAEQTVILADGKLHALPQVEFRSPATGLAARLHADAQNGTVDPNELVSFPSDHAALFTVFAFGIFLAMPLPGLVALGWAIGAVMLPRVVTGMHWPLDILAGALLGLAVLVGVLAAARTALARPVNWLVGWCDRNVGWAQAGMFLLLAEAAGAMSTLQRLVELLQGFIG